MGGISSNKRSTIKPRVVIISFPWKSHAPYKFLSDVLKILEPISDRIVLIDGNTNRINITSEKVEIRDIGVSMHYLKEIKPRFYSAILWVIKCVLAQIKESLELIRSRKNIDVVLFYMAYPYYLLPLVTAKLLLRKKTVEVITRSRPNSVLTKIISLQDLLLFNLLDGISPESQALIRDLGLDKYKNKLLPEGARFVDTTRYKTTKKINKRKDIVGYIGRLRREKGVVEFVKSIPIIAKEKKDIMFLIGGVGDLLDWTKKECKKIKQEYGTEILITGFIEEEKFPNYLNELKLLVLPTNHSEGLPTIILESMSCGTPVLATPRGAIPEIVINEETGFIIQNNSPECIAKGVTAALTHHDLEKIAENGKRIIKQKFTYKSAIMRYKKILKVITNQ